MIVREASDHRLFAIAESPNGIIISFWDYPVPFETDNLILIFTNAGSTA
jgi:hypothetical protein